MNFIYAHRQLLFTTCTAAQQPLFQQHPAKLKSTSESCHQNQHQCISGIKGLKGCWMHHVGKVLLLSLRGQGLPQIIAEPLRMAASCSSWVDGELSNLVWSHNRPYLELQAGPETPWGLFPNWIIWWLCSLQAHILHSQSLLCLFMGAKK